MSWKIMSLNFVWDMFDPQAICMEEYLLGDINHLNGSQYLEYMFDARAYPKNIVWVLYKLFLYIIWEIYKNKLKIAYNICWQIIYRGNYS